MGRAMLVLVGAVVAVQAAVGTAQAAPTGRLSGGYDVVATTASSTSGAAVGASYFQTYTLRAACSTGVCASRLTYVPDEVTRVRVALRPTGSAYAGSSTYVAPCFTPKGGILEERAYTTTEKFVINVSRTSRGVATAFTGTDELTSALTAAGRAAGCASGGTTTYTLRATRS